MKIRAAPLARDWAKVNEASLAAGVLLAQCVMSWETTWRFEEMPSSEAIERALGAACSVYAGASFRRGDDSDEDDWSDEEDWSDDGDEALCELTIIMPASALIAFHEPNRYRVAADDVFRASFSIDEDDLDGASLTIGSDTYVDEVAYDLFVDIITSVADALGGQVEDY